MSYRRTVGVCLLHRELGEGSILEVKAAIGLEG